MSTSDDDVSLRTSPLHDRHVALGAKLAEFGGWSMPLEYAGSGVIKEHTAVREAVGHLRRQPPRQGHWCAAPAPPRYVNATLSNDLGKIAPGKAQYTLCCDDATGGIVDDLIAYLHARRPGVPDPQRREHRRGAAPAQRPTPPTASRSTTSTRDHAVLAVQGPRSDEVLDAVGLPIGHDYMSFVEAEHDGAAVTVCRTGYTGERGYELVCENAAAPACGTRCSPPASRTGCCPAASAPGTPCAPRWATRCTARTSAST